MFMQTKFTDKNNKNFLDLSKIQIDPNLILFEKKNFFCTCKESIYLCNKDNLL